jgi:FG-GAP-like repeat/Right handed beta helix region
VLLTMLAAAGLAVSPAYAQTSTDPDDPNADPGGECLLYTRGSVYLSPQEIQLDQSASQTVSVGWSVQVPSGCGGITQTLNGISVTRAGSRVDAVTVTTRYALRAIRAGVTRTLATASVIVKLPETVNITRNDQKPLLLQALGEDSVTGRRFIYVANDVEMDLTGWEGIPITSGVQLIGGRTPQVPGARLYTRSFPKRLFKIGGYGRLGGNVRITGLRIEGGTMGRADADASGSSGISIQSWTNIEIDNNEIYGWRGSGVEVIDDDQMISLASNAMTVRIHDNFIHHNQHEQKDGYGVAVSNGAYALIERNVFDWNRHAIAGDGSDRSGYLAYRNLVLEHGGQSYCAWDLCTHTHTFDMHGQDDCWLGDRNCGRAGEYMDIRYNTFLYDDGHAFKLRGTPSIRAEVRDNAFKHESLWGTSTPSQTIVGAVSQTESGLVTANNQLGVDESGNHGYCDFDVDGVPDAFFATGATWWYSSGGTATWRYLNTSTKRLSQLTLGDFDYDGKCDVMAPGGMISSGGTGPWRPRVGGILWQNNDGRLALWSLNGGTIVEEAHPDGAGNGWQIRGTGDFNGDRSDDILWQNTSGQVAIWHMSQLIHVDTVYPGSPVSGDWQFQGVGDFDGDGRADILWRNISGQLAIWFKGNPYDLMYPTVFPGYRNFPEPVGLEWRVTGVGDFNGDGRSDILWRRTDGQVGIWHMAGGVRIGERYPGQGVPTLLWTIDDVGDFDADGRADILWRDVFGAVAIWLGGEAEHAVYPSYYNAGAPVDLSWQIQGAADYNTDGRADILWRNTDGRIAIWFMAGGRFLGDAYPRTVDTSWQIKGVFTQRR